MPLLAPRTSRSWSRWSFNSDSCVYPSQITALENENGSITLVRRRVDPNEDAILPVTRRAVAGPEPLPASEFSGHRGCSLSGR